MDKITHFMYVPFTGLGLYDGFRGNRWLRNRITVFKNYVVPSLINQSEKNFTLWIGWRPEERGNPHVEELHRWLYGTGLNFVFTYGGLCFWDDKYPDQVARERLATNLHLSVRDFVDYIGDSKEVLMTIQPSDDCYHKDAVKEIQAGIRKVDAIGFKHGYIMNYKTKELSEYNPKTNPPFYTIKFKKEVFIDPWKHINHAPIKSHEYVADHLKYGTFEVRGFLVGTHGENVSTYYDHPFKGRAIEGEERIGILRDFGVFMSPELSLPLSVRRKILKMLPHRIRRKVRYWYGEKLYNWLRS